MHRRVLRANTWSFHLQGRPPSAEGLEEGPRRKAEDSRGVIEQADPNQCIAFVCTLVAGPYATVCSKREAGDTNKQVEAPAPGFA